MVVFGSFIPKPPNQQITYLTPTLAGSTSMSFQPSHSSLPKCLSASLGVRWMIGQTEIKQSSNYGCKEVPLNNNWRLFFFGQIRAAHLPTEKPAARSLMQLATGRTGPTSANLFEGVKSRESHVSKHEAAVRQAASFWKELRRDWNDASFPQRPARSDVMMQ